MRRLGTTLSIELLLEEARFILKTLQRDDLFGSRVRLTDAERVMERSISLPFADYAAFLSRHGYLEIDPQANALEITDQGRQSSKGSDDPELLARLAQHFTRELAESKSAAPATSGRGAVSSSTPNWNDSSAVRARASAPMSELPQTVGGLEEVLDRRYRRGAAIGAGPVGTVYEGEHIALGRKMALKEARAIFQLVSYVRRDDIVSRFRSVVQSGAELSHPSIIQIFDHNHEREHPYFVMEHAPGGNLRRRLTHADHGRLTPPHALRVLLQLAYGLRFAHSQGVLHLGLKPENVLFDRLGNVKISDFGMSRVLDREEGSSQAPVLVSSGTVGYMAPERLQPESSSFVSPASDIYSLGILAYEMLTGRLPGRRSPNPSQVQKEVPVAFDDVFDRMTRDDLGERYKTLDDVLEGIYQAFSTKEVYQRGTILLYADDPSPLPEIDAETAPEPDEVHDVSSDETQAELSVAEARKSAPPSSRAAHRS